MLVSKSAMCCMKQHRRLASTYVKYDQFLKFRRDQAAKTLLIQVNGRESCGDLKSYLTSNFGPLAEIYHYSVDSSMKRIGTSASTAEYHWVIAELQSKSNLEEAFKACQYPENAVAFRSHMCWFSQNMTGPRKSKGPVDKSIVSEKLGVRQSDTFSDFPKDTSICEQMKMLRKANEVSEIGMRLRFLTVHHLEQSVKALMPNACALPFGSSVCGIGSNSGDLDLVLLPDDGEIFCSNKAKADTRLWFQCKMLTSGGAIGARGQSVRNMELLGDVMNYFVPGCSHVQKILRARVPIIRYFSEYTGLHCDLSMSSSSGVFMSELIYLMGCIDSRFQPLIVTIRTWAAARKITNAVPGSQPTNFMLVMLVINFLQHKKILPTWDILFNNPTKEDTRVTADGVDCTYLRDIGRLKKYFTPQNDQTTLSELLVEFFQFYGSFDFATKGVSLFTGSSCVKPSNAALYIQNPLERHMNVAKNVTPKELTKLKNELRSALWKFETLSSGQTTALRELLLPPVSIGSRQVQTKIAMSEILKD